MKVGDVMSRGLDPLDGSATVQEAATRMAELDVGALVIGSPEKLEGVLTDRDILLRVVVQGLSPVDVRARDVMTAEVHGCSSDDPVETAFGAMRERQIRRMPVYDATGKAIGIVTLGDVAKHVESPERMAEALRELSEPHRSRKATEPSGSAPPSDGEAATAQPDAPTAIALTG